MRKLNRPLLQVLGITWFAFLISGLVISVGFAIPQITVLIDRSYCSPNQWQSVVAQYEQVYEQQQQGEVKFRAVVLFSDLGEEVRSHPPAPSEIATLSTYGRMNSIRQQDLQRNYPKSTVLGCQ
jgi:hypothetical protein